MQPGVLAPLLALGAVSAVVPVVNAEALVVAAVVAAGGSPGAVGGAVLAVALGQTAGKVALFWAVRHGAQRWAERLHPARRAARHRAERLRGPGRLRSAAARWGRSGLGALDRPGAVVPLLLLSSAVGVPPLAATTVVVATRSVAPLLFTACCLAGRTARFAAVALPAALVV